MQLTRREWMQWTAGSAVAGSMSLAMPWSEPSLARSLAARPPRSVAAVVTVYKENSHADVIVGKILRGFRQDGNAGPDLVLKSLYVDQYPPSDLSRKLAAEHGFRLVKTIDEAVTLGGGQVAVDGVLSIGEHGNYPLTAKTRQRQYPRRRFFDAIVAAMKRGKRFVPVFNDKHLAYNWADANHMYQTARQNKIPFMAGSSLPVAWRNPAVELKRGTPLRSALAVGYGGLESYGFHALEALQCMIERRKGGETGIESVEVVTGKRIADARRQGRWSSALLAEALSVIPKVRRKNLEQQIEDKAAFFLIRHRDGLQSTVAMLNGVVGDFAVALQPAGKAQPLATHVGLEDKKPYGHFAWLLEAIEQMIHRGKPTYPVERTLVTTGILDAAMHSAAEQGKRIATPHMAINYQAVDWHYARGKVGTPPLRTPT